MLSARVVAEGVRACYPACLNGVYLAEEVQDFDTKPLKAAKVEIVQEELKAKVDAPALPEPPKEIIVEIEGEEISWEADWFTPEVAATLADSKEVNAFLVGKNKIKEGQTWRDITDKEYQKRINTGLARFVEAVEKAK
jgi:hypothetical protein